MILTYLFLLSALIAHEFFDWHKERVKHPIIHWLSATVVTIVSVLAGYVNSLYIHNYWWQGALYSLCIHLALFDPIWNTINQRPWYYTGDENNPNRALTDKIWSRVPPMGQILFRLWFILLGAGVYYHLDLIIG